MAQMKLVVMALSLSLLFTAQGRPLHHRPQIQPISAGHLPAALASVAGSQLQAAAAGPLRRALLSSTSTSGLDLSALLAMEPKDLIDQLKLVAPELVGQLRLMLGLSKSASAQLEAAIERFAASVIPPLLDSLKSQEQSLAAFVNNTMARLPIDPSAQDMAELLRDSEFQEELFTLLNAVFNEKVLAAIQTAGKVLAGDLYDIMDAAGMRVFGQSKEAVVGQFIKAFAQITAILKDQDTFQTTLNLMAGQLSSTLYGLLP